MSVRNPTYFKKDITKIEDNSFEFFYCKIIASENFKHPILQTHDKINSIIKKKK